MTARVLDLFRRSGDSHLGQTLTRLASLAAAAHRYQTAGQVHEQSLKTLEEQATQADSTGVGHPTRTDADPIRTEANR